MHLSSIVLSAMRCHDQSAFISTLQRSTTAFLRAPALTLAVAQSSFLLCGWQGDCTTATNAPIIFEDAFLLFSSVYVCVCVRLMCVCVCQANVCVCVYVYNCGCLRKRREKEKEIMCVWLHICVCVGSSVCVCV